MIDEPGPSERDARFPDYHASLDRQAAIVEANRCLYCFDAPCMAACPTHIDVPSFIKKIATGNLRGSARTILDANILGASCARACPVEVLCEGACVLHHRNQQPIRIGLLQRYATEWLHESGAPLPFSPGFDTGEKVALIGGGPASLACAAELRRRGVATVIYDARALPGGLNTYGVAEYKLPLTTSLREIAMLTQLGVEFRFNELIDANQLAMMEQTYDALFLGIGLGAIHRLGLAQEQLPGVTDALDLIAGYKTGAIRSVAGRVAIVGAGNTAIDAAIAAVRLGAAAVTVLYRRGVEQISAFRFEYEHAKLEGVKFLWQVQPVAIHGAKAVEAIELVRLEATEDGPLVPIANANLLLETDMVVLAIGQAAHTSFLTGRLQLERGRILVDRSTGQTSNPKYFAGGDCTNGGREVVDAVAEGKRAGIAMSAWLGGRHAHA